MSGHTPGPWRVIIDDDGNPLSGRPGVFASDELDCGIVHWDGFVQPYWRSARGDKEIHANARLIAAAPELLEACELFAAYDAGDMDDDVAMMVAYAKARDAVLSAIAKATHAPGRPSKDDSPSDAPNNPPNNPS